MMAADTFQSSAGQLALTLIGHGSLLFRAGDLVIHVDPWSEQADYEKLPKADLILITHEHHDHFDPPAIERLQEEHTVVVLTEICAQHWGGGTIMRNGDVRIVQGVSIEAVPAYNIVHMRPSAVHPGTALHPERLLWEGLCPGIPYHPKGEGNGYVITFGDRRVYVAGDTENIPEMEALTGIDIAFLPMNTPYTMTPAMVASAARSFRPRILYPYHCGDTDPEELVELLRPFPEIEVRIRAASSCSSR